MERALVPMLTPPDDLKRELQGSLPVEAEATDEPAPAAEPPADLEQAAAEAVGATEQELAVERPDDTEEAAAISLAEEANMDERVAERTPEEEPAEEEVEAPAPAVADEAEPSWLTAAADALAAPPPASPSGSGERLWALVVGADQDQDERPEQLFSSSSSLAAPAAPAAPAPAPAAPAPAAPTPAEPAPPPVAASSRKSPAPPPPLATLASAPSSGAATSAFSSANLAATSSSEATPAAVAAVAVAAAAAAAAAADGSSYAGSPRSDKSVGGGPSAPTEDPFAFAAWDSAPPIEKTDWRVPAPVLAPFLAPRKQ